ncbi:MAG: hypothetical protein ACRC33_31020, partial [Gemmataceae bacterium]
MSAVQNLSALAVRSLFEGFCSSIGFPAGPAAADAATKFLGSRFTDHSQKVSAALGRATDGAWRALELALAGDSWWDKVKASLARREDQAFREQVNAFLRSTPLANLPSHPPEFRARALADLRAARKAGALAGPIDPQRLAAQGGPFARFADPQALIEAEWQALDAVVGSLREARYAALAEFLALRPHGEMPMLVVAVRYFFRRELEDDAALTAALSFAKLEQIQRGQEAGYDALAGLIAKSAGRLDGMMDEALALLQETSADVKDIKAELASLGQSVFRALAAPSAGPGEPVRKEEDVRLAMLNTLTTTPHRDLMPLWPVHQGLCAQDPRFYVRLAAWYHAKGEVRDHKEMFVIALCLSPFDGHRDVGLALLRKLPPYQVMRVVDFIHGRKETKRAKVTVKVAVKGPGRKHAPREARKTVREVVGDFGLFRTLPRSLRTEVERYLREREGSPNWFDSTVLVARKALKRLYALLHVKPDARAQAILFDGKPPADSRLGAMRRIATAPTPELAAEEVVRSKLPFRVAVSVLPEITPKTLEALVERMTPQEVINHLGMLQRHGAMANLEVRALVELKLEAAKTDERVSTLKADVALAADVSDEIKARLEDVADVRLKAKGRLKRPTGLLVDKSGSMEVAIDAGKRIAAMLSSIAQKELYVYAFDTMAYEVKAAGGDWASWKKAFEGINAGGETSVGVALELMRRRRQAVEQLIVVTDEEEYNPPFFVESFLKYRQEMKVDPAITFVKVPDSSTKLEDQCKRAGLAYTVFEFKGDYYALPNLVSLV